MSTILAIRQRLDDGASVAQVARKEGVSEPTVRKYRDMDDFSPQIRAHRPHGTAVPLAVPPLSAKMSMGEDRAARLSFWLDEICTPFHKGSPPLTEAACLKAAGFLSAAKPEDDER